jgi:hypothetical protein
MGTQPPSPTVIVARGIPHKLERGLVGIPEDVFIAQESAGLHKLLALPEALGSFVINRDEISHRRAFGLNSHSSKWQWVQGLAFVNNLREVLLKASFVRTAALSLRDIYDPERANVIGPASS